MTHGDIYTVAYRLKVFQVWELVEELTKEWGFFGRKFIKDRVSSWLLVQIRHKTVVKVSSRPPLFAFKEFENRWQEFLRYKTCPVCGEKFLPLKSHTLYCSPKCAQKKYAKRKWQAVKPQKRENRPWTEEELRLLRDAFEEKGRLRAEDLRELSKKLGRSYKSVEHKYY
jgi:hypothetical protein